jgi:hypothetical protein
MNNAYKILIEKLEGKRPLGRPPGIWENNIKIDRRETGFESVDLIHLVQNTDRSRTLMNLRVL